MLSSVVLSSLLLLSGVCAIEPPRVPHQPLGNGTKILDYNQTTASPGVFRASSAAFDWAATEEDGQFVYVSTAGALVLESIVTGENETFVPADQLPADYWEYWIKPDLSKVLFSVNYTKQYRHSYFADYLIYDRETGTTEPLVADQVGDIQYATWNPVEDQIAFVRGNDIYIWNSGEVTRVTEDGGPDLFNGVPDWVYEEEIFGDRYTLWYSPDGEYLAYLSFNETGVPTYTVPYYMHGQKHAPSYPFELDIRYPKVGAKNPTVAVYLLTLEDLSISTIPVTAFEPEDLIIGEVAWVTDDHSHLIYRAFNRVQDHEVLVTYATAGGSSTEVRTRDGTDGWLDNNIAISYVGSVASNVTRGFNSSTYYVDISDESGWTHIYLFPVLGGKPIPLTTGEWEVRAILKIDTTRGLIYYRSTEHHSTESHVYSVSYKDFTKTALVDDAVSASWTASFSSQGGYYVLSYLGPDVPYQELYSINSTNTPIRTLTSNARLYNLLQTYNLPNITYLELQHPDGYTLNAMLRQPPNFDPSKKYPLLLIPYGGPGAQEVTKNFQQLNWKAYITSDPDLEYATLTVDNRGTGYKGRAFRSQVASRLGTLEAQDQVWAAQHFAETHSWIDTAHVGIFGWSFGGYLSAKVVELDSPAISLALITAPVSDWRLYDSMYTERYMKLPTNDSNAEGYTTGAVHSTAGFKNIAGGVLIQHGTGDDNVHFQNSAALVDLLVGEGVSPEKVQVQWFTDSDHSIVYNGGNNFLYRQLSIRLFEEKHREGEGGGHQWSRRRVEEESVGVRWAREKGIL
ncbi:hypothetical protein M501DRAFT_1018431 [Patellaria atrata CBS 101060]|uniref:dipeptidyl-peptidase IV n=1 Tax=Patellaria atrata CBS 101060 TaxID=1346257 RepID=A0A9P4VP83_9PEZI|nr:hypothetical protein M501DRAFT_1018431 [Patellaria atrata CBS 101060]